MHRLLIFAAGVFGGAGVALSALAAHSGGAALSPAAGMLLAHAPALLAIGLAGRGRATGWAGLLIVLGIALFAGDLAMRHFAGVRLFPMAAPAGGLLTIVGWLFVAGSALLGPSDR